MSEISKSVNIDNIIQFPRRPGSSKIPALNEPEALLELRVYRDPETQQPKIKLLKLGSEILSLSNPLAQCKLATMFLTTSLRNFIDLLIAAEIKARKEQ